MTLPVEDQGSLTGATLHDQVGRRIGAVKDIYAQADSGEAGWVTVEATSGGLGAKKTVFIPLARLKYEDEALTVPYSAQHIEDAPAIDSEAELSEEDQKRLRAYYGIDRGDQELRSDNNSYAAMVPAGEGIAQRVDDPDQVQTPESDRRDEETKERLMDPGSSETRHITLDE